MQSFYEAAMVSKFELPLLYSLASQPSSPCEGLAGETTVLALIIRTAKNNY